MLTALIARLLGRKPVLNCPKDQSKLKYDPKSDRARCEHGHTYGTHGWGENVRKTLS